MKFLKALLIGIASAVVAVVLIRASNWDGAAELRLASQPAFDRVMKLRTLRCISGYPAPSFSPADPDRDIRRRLTHMIVEQMGHILNLEIEWVEDVAQELVADHLNAGSEDAMCFPLWPNGKLAKVLDFTVPVDYVPAYAYARADDTRFDDNLPIINDKSVTISVMENNISKNITDEDYAQATQYSVTEETANPHLFVAITTKKADVTFSDPFTADNFIRNNSNVLKRVNGPPVRVFDEDFAVAKGETKLRDMLNAAIAQMQHSGYIRNALDKYLGDKKGEYFYTAKPWE